MNCGVVSVHFDSLHLFLDLADCRAVQLPLDRFPVLRAATTSERGHFAISLDRQHLYRPELDAEMNITALFQSSRDSTQH